MPRGKIEYKGPWGGVNTNVPATYLQPNEFPFIENFSTFGNELKSRPVLTNLASSSPAGFYSGNIAEIYTGSINSPVPVLFTYGTGNSGTASGLYQMDNFSGKYSTGISNGFPFAIAFNRQAVYYWTVYNGNLYFSGNSNYYSLAYGSPYTLSTLSTAYGGVYLTNLAQHILLGYMYNFPAVGLSRNTIVWSGSNNPTVLDPGTDNTAGNQALGIYGINGMYGNGYSVYVTHPNGIKQITPTGNSTAPFNIQDFYFGEFGVGNMYAHSLAGKGDVCFFISADDVKMLTPYGVQPIGGNSKIAIFKDLQTFITNSFSFGFDPAYSANGQFSTNFVNQAVVGSVIPSFQRGYPYPNYVITIPTNNGADTILWMYLYSEDKWIRWYCTGARIGQFKSINQFSQGGASVQSQYATALNGNATAATTCFFDALTGFNTESTGEVDFRVEDQDGRLFQCVRIRVTYRDLGICPVTFALYNVMEDGTYNNPAVTKTINLGTNTADGNIKQVYTDFVATGLFTQLKVTRAANAGACSIIKVQLLEEGADDLEVV